MPLLACNCCVNDSLLIFCNSVFILAMNKTQNCSTSTIRMTFLLWPVSVSVSSRCLSSNPSKKLTWTRLKPVTSLAFMECPLQVPLVTMTLRLEMIPMTVMSMFSQLAQSTLRPQSTRTLAIWRWLIEERSIMLTISRWNLID